MSSGTAVQNSDYVSTRYPGSKRKLTDWIIGQVRGFKFHSVLDALGGTGSVSYAFKRIGKNITYNDILVSNYYTGLALIENSRYRLTDQDVSWVLTRHKEIQYPTFIRDTFKGIYYTDHENAWLDMAITNIRHMNNRFKRALALHSLFQSCMIKRPFNSFHRRNLYLRLAHVKRSFYNHIAWERPFEEYFRKFSGEANARVCDNGQRNVALNCDILEIPHKDFDLVYFDPPSISKRGISVDYYGSYHFLEGMCDYDRWSTRIAYKSKNKHLIPDGHGWTSDNRTAESCFDKLFSSFQDSILVMSYRSPGIPSILTIKRLLEQYKRKVRIAKRPYRYVLSNNQSRSFEVLFVAS
jgi:adenine-specific DNA-methyltransferase